MTRLNLVCILTALAAPAFAIGCGDDGRVDTDSGMGGDSSMPTDTGTPVDSGMPTDSTVPPTDDGNDDFSEAEAITVGDGTGVMAAIQAPADSDYYSFDLTEGDWAIVDIEANTEDDPMMVDTVVQLFDSSMTMVAENDDSVPRVNTDSEIIYHVPATGTYYARVLEFTDWMGEVAEGEPSYTYTITVGTVGASIPSVTIDAETGDDVASAQVMNFDMDSAFIFGTFEDDSDVDVFSFSVAADQFLSLDMMPAGTMGYGSTSPIGDISITDTAGAVVIGRLNNASGDFDDFGPALPPGDYLLHVEHGGAGPGTNDFFILKGRRGTENPPEMNEVANDAIAGSEALVQTLDDATMFRRAFILAQMPTAADVDYFAFNVMAGEEASVFCGSKTSGSGVNGLSIEVRDSADAVVALGSAVETATEGASVTELALTPGDYHLRLTRGAQDAIVTSTFVRCGIATGMPAATP